MSESSQPELFVFFFIKAHDKVKNWSRVAIEFRDGDPSPFLEKYSEFLAANKIKSIGTRDFSEKGRLHHDIGVFTTDDAEEIETWLIDQGAVNVRALR